MLGAQATNPGTASPRKGLSGPDVLAARSKRRHALKKHVRLWTLASTGLLVWSGLAASMGWGGTWPWGVVLLWGGVVGAHAVNYVGWVQAHRQDLESLGASVSGGSDDSILDLHPQPTDPMWLDLWTRCVRAFTSADTALERLEERGIGPRDELRVAMGHVKTLMEGQARISTAIAALPNRRGSSPSDTITETRWALDRAGDDAQLQKLYSSNLQLMEAQEGKVSKLVQDIKRLQACVDGFVLAAHNIHLDATRAGAPGETPSGMTQLGESLNQLAREVAVLREVEAELEGL